jgi:adenylate cyclase
LVSAFSDPFGLDWLLVVVVPEVDFMGTIYTARQRTMILGIAVLGLSLLFGIVYSTRISRPIRHLTERVQRIQDFKLDNDFDIGPASAEVGALAEALTRMQAGLSSFRRFVPDDLVRRILALGEEAHLGGETRDVTVLFSDLRGYSTLTEHLKPNTVIAFMNLYFQSMQEVITEQGGIILELLGDGILAVFGAPDELPKHATAATRCALVMRERLDGLNPQLQRMSEAQIDGPGGNLVLYHRIGIHTGRVVAGNIGGQSFMKYGVVGDVVNVAARLEQLNKQYETSILVSLEVYRALPEVLQARAEDRGDIHLKGREQPQRIYSL